MAKLSEIKRVILRLEAERDLLNRCLEMLRDQQQASVKPRRKPRAVADLKAVDK